VLRYSARPALQAEPDLKARVIPVMMRRKEYSPKDLAEQFRQLKALRAEVAKAELSRNSVRENKSGANAKQSSRDPSAKPR
jgi:hypothetical protein